MVKTVPTNQENSVTENPSSSNRNVLSLAKELWGATRPKQAIKNLFVFAALLFTNNLTNYRLLFLTSSAFVAFCFVSSAIYLVNDVMDREQDRLHPEKRFRAIASGVLPISVALFAALVLGVGGIAAAFIINLSLGIVAAAYVLLQTSYSFWFKHQVILDVLVIAAGFVLRAVAGAVAINVPISAWLLVCTFLLSLFLGFGKRRNEIVMLAGDAGNHRSTLDHYSLPFLDQMIAIVCAGVIVSYSFYTISSPTAEEHHWILVTLPNVIYGLFRYLYLIHLKHRGGSPELLVLEDRPLQLNLILWIAEVAIAFQFK